MESEAAVIYMSINRQGSGLLSLYTDTRCILCILIFPMLQVIASKVATRFLELVPLLVLKWR